MVIQLKKIKNKSSVINIYRSDGSMTWTKLHPGIEDHDLAHYVVESELQFKNAFFGLIDCGFKIEDFELPKDQRPASLQAKQLPLEAIQAEYIVNLLQTEYWNSGEDPNFIQTLSDTLSQNNIPFPSVLNEENLATMRRKYRELVFQWKTMQPDQVLELEMSLL